MAQRAATTSKILHSDLQKSLISLLTNLKTPVDIEGTSRLSANLLKLGEDLFKDPREYPFLGNTESLVDREALFSNPWWHDRNAHETLTFWLGKMPSMIFKKWDEQNMESDGDEDAVDQPFSDYLLDLVRCRDICLREPGPEPQKIMDIVSFASGRTSFRDSGGLLNDALLGDVSAALNEYDTLIQSVFEFFNLPPELRGSTYMGSDTTDFYARFWDALRKLSRNGVLCGLNFCFGFLNIDGLDTLLLFFVHVFVRYCELEHLVPAFPDNYQHVFGDTFSSLLRSVSCGTWVRWSGYTKNHSTAGKSRDLYLALDFLEMAMVFDLSRYTSCHGWLNHNPADVQIRLAEDMLRLGQYYRLVYQESGDVHELRNGSNWYRQGIELLLDLENVEDSPSDMGEDDSACDSACGHLQRAVLRHIRGQYDLSRTLDTLFAVNLDRSDLSEAVFLAAQAVYFLDSQSPNNITGLTEDETRRVRLNYAYLRSKRSIIHSTPFSSNAMSGLHSIQPPDTLCCAQHYRNPNFGKARWEGEAEILIGPEDQFAGQSVDATENLQLNMSTLISKVEEIYPLYTASGDPEASPAAEFLRQEFLSAIVTRIFSTGYVTLTRLSQCRQLLRFKPDKVAQAVGFLALYRLNYDPQDLISGLACLESMEINKMGSDQDLQEFEGEWKHLCAVVPLYLCTHPYCVYGHMKWHLNPELDLIYTTGRLLKAIQHLMQMAVGLSQSPGHETDSCTTSWISDLKELIWASVAGLARAYRAKVLFNEKNYSTCHEVRIPVSPLEEEACLKAILDKVCLQKLDGEVCFGCDITSPFWRRLINDMYKMDSECWYENRHKMAGDLSMIIAHAQYSESTGNPEFEEILIPLELWGLIYNEKPINQKAAAQHCLGEEAYKLRSADIHTRMKTHIVNQLTILESTPMKPEQLYFYNMLLVELMQMVQEDIITPEWPEYLRVIRVLLESLPNFFHAGATFEGRTILYASQKIVDLLVKRSADILSASDYTHQQSCSEALKLFELTRGTVVNNLIHYRMSMDYGGLAESHPHLAKELSQIVERLDRGFSRPSEQLDQYQTLEDAFPFVLELGKRDRDGLRLEELVEEIRQVHGFENFMSNEYRGNEFSMLTARNGPIVIVSAWKRGHAVLVTREKIDFIWLDGLAEDQLAEKIRDIESPVNPIKSNKTMREFLRWLWDTVTKPILQHLDFIPNTGKKTIIDEETELNTVSKLPRVWWIGVGLMSQAPFHAAGIYPSMPKKRQYTAKYCVSSYTSTIRALAYSLGNADQPEEGDITMPQSVEHRALIVTMQQTPSSNELVDINESSSQQEDKVLSTRGVDLGDLNVLTEAENLRNSFTKAQTQCTLLESPDSDLVLCSLAYHNIVHFACHGVVNPEDPMKSCLVLQKPTNVLTQSEFVRDELKVGDIVKVRPSDTASIHVTGLRLAYLSACSSASNKCVKLSDETLHIASVFQLAGYNNIIGTLWDSEDSVCIEVATKFYEYLFKIKEWNENWKGKSRNERMLGCADALHLAVESVRNQRNCWEAPVFWAPFVHWGA